MSTVTQYLLLLVFCLFARWIILSLIVHHTQPSTSTFLYSIPHEMKQQADPPQTPSTTPTPSSSRQSYASSGGLSLASNITRYRYENGRRYHAYRDGTYYAPNDAPYQSYEATVHHLWLLTLRDRLFLAPLSPSPTRILDIGTGTGLWAVNMADAYPTAEITATDLSPILSTSAPPNLIFEIDDVCDTWVYPDSYFSLIHIRGLTGCIRDWPHTYAQAYTHLAPGGWIEHAEFSVETNADRNSTHPSHRLLVDFADTILCLGREKTGMQFDAIEHIASRMRDAGFVDVHEEDFVWPIGAWYEDEHMKEVGRWGLRNWNEGVEGWVMALYTRFLGWTCEEVKAFTAELKRVVGEEGARFEQKVRVVYARKPFQHEMRKEG